MQPAEEISNTDENGAGSRPRLHKRLAWYIARDELQDVAASLVDPEVARRLREANPVEVLEIAGDRTRPRPTRTADSVAHAHNSECYVAANQRHLEAVRGFIDGLDVHLTEGYSRHLQIRGSDSWEAAPACAGVLSLDPFEASPSQCRGSRRARRRGAHSSLGGASLAPPARKDPTTGLSRAERPKQRNAKVVARLDAATLEKLVHAAPDKRWKAALGLAAFAGLRSGEIRALRWQDVDLERSTISVSQSALADGTVNTTKTASGTRTIPIFPALRRLLVAWKVRSPKTADGDLVICTATGSVVAGTNLRRVLREAKRTAGLDEVEGRLSLHALRHSMLSIAATDMGLAATTLAAIAGHADPATTYRLYSRDSRDAGAMVADVLERAAAGGVGI